MDLKTFAFPIIDGPERTFSTQKTNPALLSEAKDRGFYNGHTPYNKLFSLLFYGGGKVQFKEGIDEEFKKKAWSYCRALMASWEPKHEEKEAVCSMLMSELLLPELAKEQS